MWICGALWVIMVVEVVLTKCCLPYFIPQIQFFQFDRLYFLYPCLCYVMLAISLNNIYEALHASTNANLAIIALAMFFMVKTIGHDQELKQNWKQLVNTSYSAEPSFRQFYAENLFDSICADLDIKDRSSVKVASLALYPAIPEYNGYYCIDGYITDYPLSYKHAFRRIICKELAKNQELKGYFDLWGNRCYVFSAQNGKNFMHSKNDTFAITELEIDVDALADLGCQYIISAVSIPSITGLRFIRAYESESSYWKLYLYCVEERMENEIII